MPRPLGTLLSIYTAAGQLADEARLSSGFTAEDPAQRPDAASLKLREAAPSEQGQLAPLTENGCFCAPPPANGSAMAIAHRCSKESGWCCRSRPEEEAGARRAGGDWCYTAGDCAGRNWDHCRPARINRAVFRALVAT